MTKITRLSTHSPIEATTTALPVQHATKNDATPLHQERITSDLNQKVQAQAQARKTLAKRRPTLPALKDDEQAEESSLQPLHPNSVAELGESSDSAVQLGSSADYGVMPSTSSDGAQLGTIDAKLIPDHLGASVAEASGSLFQSSLTSVALSSASAVAVGGGGGGGSSSSPVATSTTSTTENTVNTTAAAPETTTSPSIARSIAATSTTSGLNATGNNKANRLTGSNGANVLDGMGGDDTLEGRGGDDTLIGGTGKDTAVYKGHAADYEISYDEQSDVWRVRDLNAADGDESTDVLSGVERLQFSSGTLALFGPVRNEQGQILLEARLVGGSGADVVPMGSGYIAVGGGGDDTYIARNAQHQLLEHDSVDDDTVITYDNLSMPDNVENITLAELDEIASDLAPSNTPSNLPIVALAELPNLNNTSFTQGFVVNEGAIPSVTVNGLVLNAAQVAVKFTSSTVNGQTLYIAKAGAFNGSETVVVNASQTDAAGNTGQAPTITLKPIDTTAPTVPLVELADADNAAFDSGFTVNQETSVAVSVNDVVLSVDQVAAKFSTSTANGQITYIAKQGAFDGSETVAINATGQTDSAGNTGQASLTLKPIDTTAPTAPSLVELFDSDTVTTTRYEEFRVNTYTEGYQGNSSITALSDGGFVVSWTSDGQDGDSKGIYAQRYNAAGQRQGSEFQVNTYTAGFQHTPTIAAMSDGGFVVAWASEWLNDDGSNNVIRVNAQRYDASGQKQDTELLVNTYMVGLQHQPCITALNDGGFVVAWTSHDQDGSGYGIYAQRYNTAGQRQGAEFQVNTYTESYQYQPSITTLNDGGFVVVWSSEAQDGSGYGIYAQRYNAAGQKKGAEFQVNTYTEGDQHHPSITALNDGGFVVSWTSNGQDGNADGIYAQCYNAAGQKQGTEFLVNTYTAGSQSDSSITALSDGGFIVTWESMQQVGRGSGSDIYAQRYDASGQKQGVEFLVNSYTSSFEAAPYITALNDGGFVVSWTSHDQDGSGYGIYAQRYDAQGNKVVQTATHDSGFTVTQGASVVVTVNGAVLNADQVQSKFSSNTANGQTTYTAKTGAFDGSETVVVNASQTDAAGNTGQSTEITLKPIDTTAPVGGTGMSFKSVSSYAQDPTPNDAITSQSSGNVVFSYTGADLAAGEKFQYSINANSWVDVSDADPANNTVTINDLNFTSSPTVQIRALDAVGNATATLASQLINYENTPPTGGTGMSFKNVSSSAQDQTPNDAITNQTSGSVVFSYTGADLDSGEKFQYSTDGLTWSDVSATDANTNTVTINNLNLATSPSVQIRAISSVGVATPPLVTQKIIYDNVPPPTISALALSSDTGSKDFVTQTASQTVTASLGESLASDEKLLGTLDGTNWTDISSSVSGTSVSWTGLTLSSTPKTLQLKTTDAAGNTSLSSAQSAVLFTNVAITGAVDDNGTDTLSGTSTKAASAYRYVIFKYDSTIMRMPALSELIVMSNGVNIAKGKTVTTNMGEYSAIESLPNLTNGSLGGDDWSANGSYTTGYLMIDLGQAYHIDKTSIVSVSWMGDQTRGAGFTGWLANSNLSTTATASLSAAGAVQIQTATTAGTMNVTTTQSGSLVSTDDNTPTINGTLNAPLPSGYKVQVWNNGSYIADATVTNASSSASWSYTFASNKVAFGTNKVEAKVVDATGANYLNATSSYSFEMTNETVSITGAAETNMASGYANSYRYVYLRSTGAGSRALAEFEVWSNGVNIVKNLTGTTVGSWVNTQAVTVINDGSTSSEWYSQSSGASGDFIRFDLGASQKIDAIRLVAAANLSSSLESWVSNTLATSSSALTTLTTNGSATRVYGADAPTTPLAPGVSATGYNVTDTTPTVYGTLASPLSTGYKLAIYAGSTYLGDATVNADNTWSYVVTSPLTAGLSNVKARVVDSAGVSLLTSTTGSGQAFKVSPVVLDLNHDDQISYANTLMDVTGSGVISKVTWASPEDGVLFWNKYGNGEVHDKSQYAFGDPSKGLTDLQGLAQNFDSNHDGVFNALDDNFSQFMVWQDKNGDGLSQADEVKSLTDWGFNSINLTSDGVKRTPTAGVEEAGSTTATQNDGQSMLVADAMFSYTKAIVLQGVESSQDSFEIEEELTQIKDFKLLDGDVIDLSSLLSELHAKNGNASDYVQTVQRGNDTVIQVDATGHRDFAHASNQVVLTNITTTLEQLQQQHHIVL